MSLRQRLSHHFVRCKLSRRAGLPTACKSSFSSASVVGSASTGNLTRGLLLALGLGTAGYCAANPYSALTETAQQAYLIPLRLARDVTTAASIVADYKLSLRNLSDAEKEQEKHACHQRSADKLVKLCFANGGIYIKLGQHIGQLDHLLPDEYVKTARANLLDKCPVSTLEEVRQVISEDLGAPPEAIFASFDATPIASASLAQVHRATAHDGRQLAVKVQHAGLRETCAADVATVEALVGLLGYLYPDYNYSWLVDEIHENLPRELDFKHEAANAERCRANLQSPKSRVGHRVHVPEIDHTLTSSRVLTMEYIEGVGVTDTAQLKACGISTKQLAKLISETFNEMIFVFGDVHCDPHAANMLAREQNGRLQLVLLDHGLYKQIDDQFRQEYAALWRSLIFADEEGIKRHSEHMNAGHAYPLFAAMLTQRPWNQIMDKNLDHLSVPVSQEHKDMAQEYVQAFARDISDLLVRMPRPLLLLLKTNDCLRSVDKSLGQPVNTMVITARECTRALGEMQQAQSPGIRTWLHVRLDLLRVEVKMAMLSLISWWMQPAARRG